MYQHSPYTLQYTDSFYTQADRTNAIHATRQPVKSFPYQTLQNNAANYKNAPFKISKTVAAPV